MELHGREMADEFCLRMPDFHVTFRDVSHAVNLRHRTDGFTSPPKEGLLKNPTASVGFETANLGTKGQHATSRAHYVTVMNIQSERKHREVADPAFY